MALQGDLKSFALPDVLRLLAGTGKSGLLEVVGATGSGEVLLRHGSISAASTTTAPRSSDPSDVIFELLRLEDGSFAFEEGEVTDQGIEADVDATITHAQALVEEWAEIEAVVPSMDAWISLAPELRTDEVIVSADGWRVLAAVGGGGTVHDLAAALGLSDLAASRQVVELVDAQLALVRASHGYQPPRVALDDFDQYEEPMGDPISHLEDLVAEDRPVVMEDREDALLPEPLPGEGVAYEGEAITGFVDGRTFDSLESLDSFETQDSFETHDSFEAYEPYRTPVDAPEGETFEAFESLASFEAAAAMSDRIDEYTVSADEVYAPIAEPAEVPDLAPAAPAPTAAVDDERDSLLKFLSSVKP